MRRIFKNPYFWTGGTAALIFGLLQSLPYWRACPSRENLLSAARGCAAVENIAGVLPASGIDFVQGWLWRTGGIEALSWTRWGSVWLGWTLAVLVVFAGVAWILRLLPDRWVRGLLLGTLVLLLAAVCVRPVWLFVKRSERTQDIRLIAARDLTEKAAAASGGRIFTNASALPDFLLFAPSVPLEPVEVSRLALHVPGWREALRQKGWTTVALTGPVAEYRPLLEHLAAAPDWRLEAIDNHGFIFRRGSGLPARFSPEAIQLDTPLDTAIYLAQTAEKLDALRKTVEARACITRALELAPNDTTVLVHAANFYAARKRWQDAIIYCNRALQEEPHAIQAKLVKALALMEIGQADEAGQLVSEVLLQAPDDRYSLFLSARISRARYDYAREAETLENLVRLAIQNGESPVDYQIYLGQAYARLGLPRPALDNYRAALTSERLNQDARAELVEAVRTIEENQKRN